MSEIIELTEEQFEEQFTRVHNPFDVGASWNGTMFETYGEELAHVYEKSISSKNVWTLVEGDDDTMYISNGMRVVNRLGYFITKEEWKGETDVTIDVSMD